MPSDPTRVDLSRQPGHLARRVQQIAVALFVEEIGDVGLTPVQYSSLQTVCNAPGIDQKTLATTIGYDTSTIGGVVDRLEARGLVERRIAPDDRRARRVSPTDAGREAVRAAVPRMLRAQERLLEALAPAERTEFMRLMQVVIDAHSEPCRTPPGD